MPSIEINASVIVFKAVTDAFFRYCDMHKEAPVEVSFVL